MGLHLILILAAGSLVSTLQNWLIVGLGLGAVIFVHELGHFLVAKACGVKCEKFYIGFDVPLPFGLPSKLYKVQWGETEYGIGVLPLGGYVKMLGQDDNPANAAKERERSRLAGQPAGETSAGSGASEAKAGAETEKLDPRSYQAKSVPQRMAIISAGVIMNLIFAVIFASLAYFQGVKYSPCIIGGTVPGDPAWMADLPPGTKIVQVGGSDRPNEQLRFDRDLAIQVALNGDDHDLELLVRRPGSSETETVTLRPVQHRELDDPIPSLGISPGSTLDVQSVSNPRMPAMLAGYDHEDGTKDTIVAVNGQAISTHRELSGAMLDNVDRPVTITIRRENTKTNEKETLDLNVGVFPMRWLGLAVEIGPLVAVRPNSPAAAAGFKEGDTLVTLEGEPIGDPVTLPLRLYRRIGKETRIEVKRTEGEKTTTVPLVVTPGKANLNESVQPTRHFHSVECIGIAYGLGTRVSEVEEGGPAHTAGLRVGDVLRTFRLAPVNDEAREDDLRRVRAELFKPQKFSAKDFDWLHVHYYLQNVRLSTRVELVYARDGEEHTTKPIRPEVRKGWYNPERGFGLKPFTETRQAEHFGEACSLGVQETWDAAFQVLRTLKALATGRISAKNLGGPGTIVAGASMEVSQGISRYLIFLTLLSANLAVLNFLPIPVLDGGHMVFLAYEGLRGKPPNERVQVTLTIIGLVLLLALMAFAITMDVIRFGGW